MPSTIDDVEENRSKLDIGTRAYIDRLPTELISEILLYSPLVHSNIDVNQPPWIFGKVSRRWRTVCLGTPSLWVNIPPIKLSFILQNTVYLGLLRTMLEFSDPMRIAISTEIDIPSGASEEEQIQRSTSASMLISLLALHKDRFSSLKLHIDVVFLPLLDGIPGSKFNSFEKLEFLRLQVATACMPSGWLAQRSPVFLESAPMLKEVTVSPLAMAAAIEIGDLTSDSLVSNPLCLQVPWSQLTHLTLSLVSVKYVLDVLRHTPLLGQLVVEGVRKGNSPSSLVDPIVLRHLRILILRKMNTIPTEELCHDVLLKCLNLPSLRDFVCIYYDDHTEQLIDLIDRSGCSLKSLSTRTTDRNLDHMRMLYSKMPDLHSLDIEDVQKEELALLSDTSLLPKLRYFSIYNPPIRSYFADSCGRFLASRTKLNDDGTPPSLHVFKLLPYSGSTELYYHLEKWANDPKTDPKYREVLRWRFWLERFRDKLKDQPPSKWIDERIKKILHEIEHRYYAITTKHIFASRICDVLREITSQMKMTFEDLGKPEIDEFATIIEISSRFKDKLREWETNIDEYWQGNRWIVVDSLNPDEDSDLYFVTKEGQSKDSKLRKLREARKLPPGELNTLLMEDDGPRRVRRLYRYE